MCRETTGDANAYVHEAWPMMHALVFIPLVAGRYDMKRGVKERFGEDIFDRLERLGHIKSSVKTSEGATVPFMLTKAVRDGLSYRAHSCLGTCTFKQQTTTCSAGLLFTYLLFSVLLFWGKYAAYHTSSADGDEHLSPNSTPMPPTA